MIFLKSNMIIFEIKYDFLKSNIMIVIKKINYVITNFEIKHDFLKSNRSGFAYSGVDDIDRDDFC